MSLSTHYSPSGDWVSCGLPSPGSRRQSIQIGLRPATVDSILTTKEVSKVTCKRCRKSSEFLLGHAAMVQRVKDSQATGATQP